MRIALIATLALQAAAAPLPVVAQAPVLTPPFDWNTLAPLPFVTVPVYAAILTLFVADEVRAGRCTATLGADGKKHVDLPLAVLAGAGGIKRVVPRAIHCPTVEQYSAGLILRAARDNLRLPAADGWYRTSMTYSWSE